MSNGMLTLTEGNYLRIVVGLNMGFCEGHSLSVEFSAGSTCQREDLPRERMIYVLCKTQDIAVSLKSQIDKSFNDGVNTVIEIGKKDGVVKILDPNSLTNLGDNAKFSTAGTDGYGLVLKAYFIKLEWIPIENGKLLRIDAKKDPLEVLVVDRKIGEIAYRTDAIEIRGTDLRVYGDQIRYEKKNTIVVKNWVDGSDGKVSPLYQLEVQGTGLEIKDIRTSDVERITIGRSEKIKVQVGGGDVNKAVAFLINWWKAVNWRAGFKSIFYSFNFFVLLVTLVAMTWLPFGQVNYALDKYNEMRRSIANTPVESVRLPVKVSNKLSLQMVGSAGETNNVATTSTSTSSTEKHGVGDDKCLSQGGGVVTFYFVMACLLYVMLYAIVIFVAFVTFKAMRRHNKMTRNMSAVIGALRNERDKEKRRAMQKKILDDMIDTYLDRPSSDE